VWWSALLIQKAPTLTPERAYYTSTAAQEICRLLILEISKSNTQHCENRARDGTANQWAQKIADLLNSIGSFRQSLLNYKPGWAMWHA
jgi:hypothetical protein